ncbi:hypothetical protein PCE1_001762 [Barthelona sp. PCE]
MSNTNSELLLAIDEKNEFLSVIDDDFYIPNEFVASFDKLSSFIGSNAGCCGGTRARRNYQELQKCANSVYQSFHDHRSKHNETVIGLRSKNGELMEKVSKTSKKLIQANSELDLYKSRYRKARKANDAQEIVVEDLRDQVAVLQQQLKEIMEAHKQILTEDGEEKD